MVTLFFNILYGLIFLITSPIRILPNVVLNSGFANSVTTGINYLYTFDFLVPVNVILAILGISVVIEGAYLLYKFIMWLVKRFPTQS